MSTNNQAKIYAFLQGFIEVSFIGIMKLMVFGISSIIIHYMKSNSTHMDFKLARIITRVRKESQCFDEVHYFNILGSLKHDGDLHANQSTRLEEWKLCKNEDTAFNPIF